MKNYVFFFFQHDVYTLLPVSCQIYRIAKYVAVWNSREKWEAYILSCEQFGSHRGKLFTPAKSLPYSVVYDRKELELESFYRAMLCIRAAVLAMALCLSVRLSVRLSVTSRCSTKTAKRRITQTTPHDNTGTLIFWYWRSPRNSTGVTPYEGAECRWGGSKSATFDQ